METQEKLRQLSDYKSEDLLTPMKSFDNDDSESIPEGKTEIELKDILGIKEIPISRYDKPTTRYLYTVAGREKKLWVPQSVHGKIVKYYEEVESDGWTGVRITRIGTDKQTKYEVIPLS